MLPTTASRLLQIRCCCWRCTVILHSTRFLRGIVSNTYVCNGGGRVLSNVSLESRLEVLLCVLSSATFLKWWWLYISSAAKIQPFSACMFHNLHASQNRISRTSKRRRAPTVDADRTGSRGGRGVLLALDSKRAGTKPTVGTLTRNVKPSRQQHGWNVVVLAFRGKFQAPERPRFLCEVGVRLFCCFFMTLILLPIFRCFSHPFSILKTSWAFVFLAPFFVPHCRLLGSV